MRRLVRLLPLILLLVFTMSSLAQEAELPIFSDPRVDAPELTARGEFFVGVQTLELTNVGIVDVLNIASDPEAVIDRTLTVEVWYPGIVPADAAEMTEYTDNNIVEGFQFRSRAFRDALPDDSGGPYPLIIMSHGLGGTRLQMTYLGDNLASKGYIVVAIDHADGAVGLESIQTGTLYRPLDIQFVLNEMAAQGAADSDSFLAGIVDAENTGLIGYSYGGYGTLVAAGAGISEGIVSNPLLSPGGATAVNAAGTAQRDPRIKAVYAFAPFGNDLSALGLAGVSFWDADGLAAIDIPLFVEVGSEDDVALYETGAAAIYEGATNSERYLLTMLEARHNVAPNPQPPTDSLDVWFRHGEPVWDAQHLNNIAQHFTTAFFGLYLKGMDYAPYLDLIENARDGVVEDGTYWAGFQPRTALGMTFASASAGE